jgi:AAA+ ATPase superfamily predicted ATPase
VDVPKPSTTPPLLLSRFIGREREIADIRRLLPEHRLITLSGPGGCGKTRLDRRSVGGSLRLRLRTS